METGQSPKDSGFLHGWQGGEWMKCRRSSMEKCVHMWQYLRHSHCVSVLILLWTSWQRPIMALNLKMSLKIHLWQDRDYYCHEWIHPLSGLVMEKMNNSERNGLRRLRRFNRMSISTDEVRRTWGYILFPKFQIAINWLHQGWERSWYGCHRDFTIKFPHECETHDLS